MYYYYLIALAIVPVILLCKYIYNKDVDKEPKKLLKRVFVWGMLAVIPILLLELGIDKVISTNDNSSLLQLFAATFIGVALIEEGFKWLVVYYAVYKHREFNHAYDGIVYSVYASLGFAVVENFFYVINGGFGVGLLRAFVTVPAHACDAVLMGYFLGRSKQAEFNNNQVALNRNMALSLLIPITAHALYDYFIFTQKPLFTIIFFMFTIWLFIICLKLIKKVSLIRSNFDGTPIMSSPNPTILSNIKRANPSIGFWYTFFIISVLSGILFFIGLTLNSII